MEENKKEIKLTTARIFAYIFGSLFLVSGIGMLFSSFVAGVLFILVSVLLMPPFYSFLRTKTKISLSRNLRILVSIALIVFAGFALGSGEDKVATEVKDNLVQQESKEVQAENTSEENDIVENSIEQDQPKPAPIQQVEVKNQPTLGERQALSSAKNYLNFTGFSRKGLIEQLEYEGYSHEEAVYGVDNSNADWNQQASISAKNYLEFTAFSRSGLIEQLEYEGYTRQQAEYGANAVGY